MTGLTFLVPHCSGSSPGPCPGTGHSQCVYTTKEVCMLRLMTFAIPTCKGSFNFFSFDDYMHTLLKRTPKHKIIKL